MVPSVSVPAEEETPVVRALRRHHIPVLRQICVHESDDAIVLTGKVPRYYLKQLAQEAVLPLRGGRKLQNLVEVVRGDS